MTNTTEYGTDQRLAAATALAPYLRGDTDTIPDVEHTLVLRDECFFNVLSHWVVRGDVRKSMEVPAQFVAEVDVLMDALGVRPEKVTTAAKPFAKLVDALPTEVTEDQRYPHVIFAIMVIAVMGGYCEGDFVNCVRMFNDQVMALMSKGVDISAFPQSSNCLELVEIAKVALSTGGAAIAKSHGFDAVKKWFAVNLQFKFGALTEDEATGILAEEFDLDPSQITHMTMDLDGPVDESDLGRMLREQGKKAS